MEDGRRRDYGACVPDVEPEERVTLEEDPAGDDEDDKGEEIKDGGEEEIETFDGRRARESVGDASHARHVCIRARDVGASGGVERFIASAVSSPCEGN